jgi:hypothetical protein
MKKAILFAILLMRGKSLMAQDQQFHFPNGQTKRDILIINGILSRQSAHNETANKPTTIKQRVVAQTFINYNNEQQDSFTYRYSGTHSSNYNFDNNSFQYNIGYQNDYIPANVWIKGVQIQYHPNLFHGGM